MNPLAPGLIPRVLLVLSLALAAPTLRAHTDEYLATRTTPHGGQLRMSGPFHLELVVRSEGVEVYVTDHGDQEIDTAGWTGEVVALVGGNKSRLALTPAGGNCLQGAGTLTSGAERKLVVVVQPREGESQSARFTLP